MSGGREESSVWRQGVSPPVNDYRAPTWGAPMAGGMCLLVPRPFWRAEQAGQHTREPRGLWGA